MNAPITVHRPSPSGGRQVTVHRAGPDEILGLAHSDHDFDGPSWVEWRGGQAHVWKAA
ncbi:hypothetical protein ACIQCR_12565 [Streptomyces sp. NPDC093249]|uniref:hypothetical protein n=1 Tax=unclassified Streptomyces TaxID=2593676 RepID=UPI00344C5AED